MREMSEAEIYNFIIKDGTSLEAIRKNTQKLREILEDEVERRNHSFTRLDPDNKDRHEKESARTFEEKNRKIDSVLLKIAENASAKLPFSREAALKVSTEVTGSRKSANRVRGFIRGALSVYLWAIVSTSSVIIMLSAMDYISGANYWNSFARWKSFFESGGLGKTLLVVLAFAGVFTGIIRAINWKE